MKNNKERYQKSNMRQTQKYRRELYENDTKKNKRISISNEMCEGDEAMLSVTVD